MRTIGLELEFDGQRVGRETLKAALVAAVRQFDPHRSIGNEHVSVWTIKGDVTCGHEITSPALEFTKANMTMLENIVNSIRDAVAGQNVCTGRCGFHVHAFIGEMDVRQLRNVLRAFTSFEHVLLALQPRSRRNSQYAEHIADRGFDWINTFNPASANGLTNHFSGFGFGRFASRGTVEIRYGAGTVQGDKVVGWINTLVGIIEVAKRWDGDMDDMTTENVDDLADFLDNETGTWLDEEMSEVKDWIRGRHRTLNAVARPTDTTVEGIVAAGVVGLDPETRRFTKGTRIYTVVGTRDNANYPIVCQRENGTGINMKAETVNEAIRVMATHRGQMDGLNLEQQLEVIGVNINEMPTDVLTEEVDGLRYTAHERQYTITGVRPHPRFPIMCTREDGTTVNKSVATLIRELTPAPAPEQGPDTSSPITDAVRAALEARANQEDNSSVAGDVQD